MNLKKPKPPSFNSIAARKTEPKVDASTCASGNHKWNGNTGILIKKLKDNNGHKNICFLKDKFKLFKTKSPEVPASKYKIIRASKIKKDPNKV